MRGKRASAGCGRRRVRSSSASSATHLRRAQALFESQGVQVLAAPAAGSGTEGGDDPVLRWLPSISGRAHHAGTRSTSGPGIGLVRAAPRRPARSPLTRGAGKTRYHGADSNLSLSKSMIDRKAPTLSDVKRIAAAAEAEAIANHWVVTIAIADDGGHLLWLQRLDGAPPVSSAIAPAKARTAAMGRRESKVYEDVINGGRYSFLSRRRSAGHARGRADHRRRPVRRRGGRLGVKSNEDAQIARAGIAAL
jgi:uncharacterized protein GlcG (DUF336 family)